jgi:fatty-acid desaturase
MKNFFASSTRGAQVFLLTALAGSILGVYTYGVGSVELLLISLGYFVYLCLGIDVTYHRRMTHNSYKTFPWLTNILSVVGCFAGTGSP